MTSFDVISALAAKYCSPEYAFLTEVRNSVGFQRKVRTADAMAMSLWPSRGLYMTGFEVKVSRTDWKKELEQPEKAEEMARFCKHWFIACPAGLISKDEVPPGWGLITVKEGGALSYIKAAPEYPDTQEPSWILFGSLMRDVAENWVPKSLLEQRVEAAVSERKKLWESSRKYELNAAEKTPSDLRKQVSAFEQASGIKLDAYSEHFNEEIGHAVRLIRHWKGTPPDQLSEMRARIYRLAEEVSTVIAAIGTVKTQEQK